MEYDYEDLVPDSPSDLSDGIGAHGGAPLTQGPPGAHGYDRYVPFSMLELFQAKI